MSAPVQENLERSTDAIPRATVEFECRAKDYFVRHKNSAGYVKRRTFKATPEGLERAWEFFQECYKELKKEREQRDGI